ncbi:DUF58 domain-containing protein [Cohaesibacter gelatinilyticus]|uniref:Uncharacterized conserved protein, DUF58 family, contains vWF domain n=1 Tax=Cohaesibacter gelatinilyticus TaxID=372072 RepID=A0A285NG32_9HYPH|nr:DUF58 domain-containing protein [Cohaesibacter gelatinilyticus]SNZ06611.1 Uncharacterized conserved protein, DUF58 family, contains vWF domain [Cohaesibacter gelatinilyticus]
MSATVVSVLIIVGGESLHDFALLPPAALGMMLVVDLLLSFSRPRNVETDVSDEVFIGEEANIRLQFGRFRSDLRVRIDWPEGLKGPVETVVDRETSVATARFKATRRGSWAIDYVWIAWESRFQLLEFVPRLQLGTVIRVVPNIRLVQSGAITTKVLSSLYGVKENRSLGEGSEFHQLQEFVTGMDPRTIDWKRSAKLRSLVAKDSQAERNHHVIIALDNGYLMAQKVGTVAKIDFAVTAALAVAWAAAIGGDLVGYLNYDVKPRQYFAPEPGRKAFTRLRSHTADMNYVTRETNHTLALTELYARSPKRSLIIVFTDFIDTTSAELMIENINLLAKRHLVIFVTIRDPELDGLARTAADTLDDVAGTVAAHQTLNQRRLVLERIERMGVTIVDTTPEALTAQLISTYLDIKAREMI